MTDALLVLDMACEGAEWLEWSIESTSPDGRNGTTLADGYERVDPTSPTSGFEVRRVLLLHFEPEVNITLSFNEGSGLRGTPQPGAYASFLPSCQRLQVNLEMLPFRRGDLVALAPSGGPEDPQLRDGLRDVPDRPGWTDLAGGWLDDPLLDDGLISAGLVVPAIGEATLQFGQAVEYRLAWSVLGNRYHISWANTTSSSWEAMLYRDEGAEPTEVMFLPFEVNATAGVLRATVPLEALGSPGPEAAFDAFEASSQRWFLASAASSGPDDIATENVRAFYAGVPAAGAPLQATGAPPPVAPEGWWSPWPVALGVVLLLGTVAAAAATRRSGPGAPVLAAPPVPGQRFLGQYDVQRELGRGAFGATWLATQVALQRPVVIKQLHPEWSAVPEARTRFEREARILAGLDHPRVTRIHHVELAGSSWYLIMEYVDGGSLEDRLREGPLTVPEAVRLSLEALEGLGYIHARGVVHRDIKPSNLLLTREGHLKVADFGVSKVQAPSTSTMATAGTTPPGTPLFMSPEHVRGQPLDARSDLYALGATVYMMLTGRHYLAGPTDDPLALAQAIASEPPVLPVPGLPAALNAWLAQALAKRPEDRFPDAAAMAAALTTVSARDTPTRRA